MDSLDANINKFFSVAVSALKQENKFLEEYFSACEKEFGFYKDRHQGIWILFETTMVYLIFRRLLCEKFPLEIKWEWPYPYPNKKCKVDIVLGHDKNNKAYIEFKTWSGNSVITKPKNSKLLEDDIRKLESLSEPNHGFVFLLWVDINLEKIEKTLERLQQKYNHLVLIQRDSFNTWFCDADKLQKWTIMLAIWKLSVIKNRICIAQMN